MRMLNIIRIAPKARNTRSVVYSINGNHCCSFVPESANTRDRIEKWLEESIGAYNVLDLRRKEELSADVADGAAYIHVEQMRGARGWVARITGTDDRFGLARKFERASYTALGSRGRGDKTYRLREGIYEASSTWRSMREHRVLFQVFSSGRIEIIESRHEVLARIGG